MRKSSDWFLLLAAWVLCSCSLSAFATTLVVTPTTLLELPWLAIGGGCFLSFLGGLINTTRAMLNSSKASVPIDVRMQLLADTVMSLVLGVVTFAVVQVSGQGVYFLLAALPITGYGGARILDPAVDSIAGFVASVFKRGDKS